MTTSLKTFDLGHVSVVCTDAEGEKILGTYASRTELSAETDARSDADNAISTEVSSLIHLDEDGKFYVNVEE